MINGLFDEIAWAAEACASSRTTEYRAMEWIQIIPTQWGVYLRRKKEWPRWELYNVFREKEDGPFITSEVGSQKIEQLSLDGSWWLGPIPELTID